PKSRRAVRPWSQADRNDRPDKAAHRRFCVLALSPDRLAKAARFRSPGERVGRNDASRCPWVLLSISAVNQINCMKVTWKLQQSFKTNGVPASILRPSNIRTSLTRHTDLRERGKCRHSRHC